MFRDNYAVNISARYQQIGQAINNRIASEPDNFILGTSEQELLEYYFSPNHYTPIELDAERTETIEIKKITKVIPAHQREGPFQYNGDLPFEHEYVTVRIPIKPHPQLEEVKRLEPSSYSTGFFGETLQWTLDAILFDVPVKGYGFNKDEGAVEREIKQSIEWVRNKLSHIAAELERYNHTLRDGIQQSIQNRKRKIEQDNDRYSSLLKKINIPIRQKEDEAVKRIQLDPKPLIQRVRPTPQQPEEYELDQKKVLDIITVLDNQGRQFEKTPHSYRQLGEEALRDILLVNLNAIFEGKATGETFCTRGKTDIYLNINKGNILSFECKIWSGQLLYRQTIDQLLSYLTWRMNYGVIILFSRQKNFTNVLTEGKAAIQNHTSYRSSFREITNTHYLSSHVLPGDEHKQVEIHHLFYNLYSA